MELGDGPGLGPRSTDLSRVRLPDEGRPQKKMYICMDTHSQEVFPSKVPYVLAEEILMI